MKKILVLITYLLVSSMAYSEEPNTLVIKLRDGNINTYFLSEKPTVTFPNGDVVISNGTINTRYMRSEVERFYFIFDDGSDIGTVSLNNVAFYFLDGKNIQISGLKKNTVVSVYTLDGKNISTQKSDGTDSITVSLGNLPNGVYIISYNKLVEL